MALPLNPNLIPMKTILLLIAIITLSACTTGSGVQSYGPQTYTVVRGGRTGFTSLATLKSEAYIEANAFATSKGKQIEVVDVKEVPTGLARWPQVEIHFKLIDK